ncbi:ImmA/IrrE family metallo-endopeptidase [Heyndrickxia sp. NPDC080065]|uniref:ImmA/IrrE family metallo-endopeptidase n=1 Tax=Heyndrickxia sp. NPDC080065 TaxID=3390568 RepID=UPI003CFC005D
MRANLFAAIFLVPKHVLEQELLFLDIHKNAVSSEQAVELAHIFQVPYKSMVRRLYEIGHIKKTLMNKLLAEPNVLLIRRKLQLENLIAAKPIIHYEGLAKNACDLYQEGLISPKRLRNLLSLLYKELI